MGVVVIDRRLDPPEDKFGTDRQRFLERYRDIIKDAVNKKVAQGGMRDFEADGIVVPLPPSTILEPVVHHGEGGKSNRVFPGLMKFEVGDQIPKPQGGSGGGGKGDPSADGEGNDDFVWLSPEEMLNILFEGRQLPDMTKFKAPDAFIVDREHAGYTNKGPSQKLDMDITNRKRAGEALILSKMGEKRVIENLTEQYNIYASYKDNVPPLKLSEQNKSEKLATVIGAVRSLKDLFSVEAAGEDAVAGKENIIPLLGDAVQILKRNVETKDLSEEDRHRLGILAERFVEQMKAGASAGRYRPEHMTYKYDDDTPRPAAQAVLVCKMDVSYSMDQERKNTAKSFFWLMNKFLTTKYKGRVDIVLISHKTKAEEVDEQTFFYGTETGGTVVSTCLEKAKTVIAERYPPSEWNIYGVQASDGENSRNDNMKVVKLLEELLPIYQAYYYIQVAEPNTQYSDQLLPVYKDVAEKMPGKLYMAQIESPAEALDAFKTFFPVGASAKPQSFAYTASP